MAKPLAHFCIEDSREATPTPCECTREIIRSKCQQASTALRNGNHTEALRIMDETLSKHGDSAFAHRVQGTIHEKVTALVQDLAAKQMHIKSAIDSAKRATELAPNSTEFACFYASLVFDYAAASGGYELALAECERALNVENPVDPAEEAVHVSEEIAATSTPEARISKVQEELRSLIQKCSLASISIWMRSLTLDRYHLGPVCSPAEQNEYYRFREECFAELKRIFEPTDSSDEEIEGGLLAEPEADAGDKPPPYDDDGEWIMDGALRKSTQIMNAFRLFKDFKVII